MRSDVCPAAGLHDRAGVESPFAVGVVQLELIRFGELEHLDEVTPKSSSFMICEAEHCVPFIGAHDCSVL